VDEEDAKPVGSGEIEKYISGLECVSQRLNNAAYYCSVMRFSVQVCKFLGKKPFLTQALNCPMVVNGFTGELECWKCKLNLKLLPVKAPPLT
jgi:hypothetical protein